MKNGMEDARKPLLSNEGSNHPSADGLKDLEQGKQQQQQLLDAAKESAAKHANRTILGIPLVIIAGICYCTASGCLILLNKHALASFGFRSPNALLVFQCLVAAVLVKVCEMLGYVSKLQPLSPDLVKTWVPVNLVFAGAF